MLLKRGIHANRDPSTIYTTLQDAEESEEKPTEIRRDLGEIYPLLG